MTEIVPLYSQPFTNSYFQFPIILQSVTSQMLLQWSELHYSVLWAVKWCICVNTCQKVYFNHDRIFKLLPRWGKGISMFGEYDGKWWYFGGVSDLHWRLWWLITGAQEQWNLIYCTFPVGFKYLYLHWFKNCEHTKKQHKIPIKMFTFFCVTGCGYIRGWIGPVRRSLIIHSLSHSFLFADGRFSTISLRGANTVSPFRGTETMW